MTIIPMPADVASWLLRVTAGVKFRKGGPRSSATALALRGDLDAVQLRVRARQSDDADQVRRLLALAAIYDGASRTEAAQVGGVTRQIVRD